MAKIKFYAVKNGRNPGIYNTWDECKAQVDGFSGAVYKSFASRDEAVNYIAAEENKDTNVVLEDNNDPRFKIYVDGSYDNTTKRFSYGMVVVYPTGETITGTKAYNDEDLAQMRNVAGEIQGAMAAIDFCVRAKIKEVILYYDYEGIAKWPLREWKANKPGTIAYVNYYDRHKEQIKIEFRHVKGHSGNKYNEMADKLAKSALGL
jgi:ribonuclease HI